MLTEPSVALIVPLALMALLHTGKPISLQRLHVAHAAVDDQARAPRALKLVASRSPKKPSVLSAVTAATTMSPGLDLLGRDVHHPVVARAAAAR